MTLVTLVGSIAMTTPAQAAPEPTPPSRNEVTVREAAMVLDCSSLSSSAAKYAVEHDICTKDGRAVDRAQEGVSIQDERVGRCGTARPYLYNAGQGHAGFHYGYSSSLGAVAGHHLYIKWANHDESTTGNWVDSSWPWSSTYAAYDAPFTGSGYVTSGMSGDVNLVWGGGCTIVNPTSSTTVSW
ncbi:hypothetical protein ACLQ2R_30985 [Streptosporangium sp. DT93]|uniref:hypothetical protein n=1 Tax=Streptosporangium sp. DT93 TaxID=3393428 RepID=UPI003CF9BB4E